jgi:hypothetical protein
VAVLQGFNNLSGIVSHFFLGHLNSAKHYLLFELGKKTFFICVLQDHDQLIALPEITVHLENVGMIHK